MVGMKANWRNVGMVNDIGFRAHYKKPLFFGTLASNKDVFENISIKMGL